jgi:protein-S-isoprenylcysteine O-methyltransferase Ste14
MELLKRIATVRKRPPGVLLLVPRRSTDRGEKVFHRRVVSIEQLAVQVTWIPIDHHPTKVEDCYTIMRHRRYILPLGKWVGGYRVEAASAILPGKAEPADFKSTPPSGKLSLMSYLSGIFIALCFALFVLFIAIQSIRIRDGGKRPFEFRFWLFAVLFILVLVFHRWLGVHSGRILWLQTVATDVLADLAALLGLVLVIQSRRALGQNWSSEVVVQEKHELIEQGPYAYIRHPMYSGLLLMLLGVALYYGREVWIIIFVCCLFGLYFKSRTEERLLTKSFPAYSQYKRRTKALIPFVW